MLLPYLTQLRVIFCRPMISCVALAWVSYAQLTADDGVFQADIQRITEHRWTYESLDEVTLRGPSGEVLSWSSNALVVITMRGNRIILATRPDVDRPAEASGGAPVNQLRFRYNDQETLFPLPAVRIAMRFEPGERGPVAVLGVGERSRDLAEGLIAQGPSANILTSGAEIPYAVQVMANNQMTALRGFQTNGDLWVDLQFTALGDAEVGGDGWQLPMHLRLPRQSLAQGTIEAASQIDYSSVRIGPEGSTETVTVFEADDWVLTRTSVLRPVLVSLPESGPEGVVGLRDVGLDFADASRTLLLSLWGVQRVAGLREVGIAQWLSATVADAAAEDVAESIEGAAVILNRLAEISPQVAAPPRGTVAASDFAQVVEQRDALELAVAQVQSDLDAAQIALAATEDGGSWRWYAAVDASVYTVDSESVAVQGRDSEAVAGGVNAHIGFTFGDQWRFGPMLTLRTLAADSDAVAHTILLGGGHVRADYVGESLRGYISFGVEAGPVRVRAHSSADGASGGLSFVTDTNPLAGSAGLGAVFDIGESFGVGVSGQFITDGDFTLLLAQPSVLWYASPRTEIRFMGSFVDLQQDLSVNNGEDVISTTMTGFGGGVGVGVRW